MIQLSNAGKRFGPKLLFDNLNWLITPKDRVGLVGANGTGKSTLLKVLAGIETLDYGSISQTKGITAGYLPQDGLSLSGRTVFDECMSVFADLKDMEREMEDLTHRMADLDPSSVEYHQVADRFQRLESEYGARDGYMLEAHVGTVLSGLGFPWLYFQFVFGEHDFLLGLEFLNYTLVADVERVLIDRSRRREA